MNKMTIILNHDPDNRLWVYGCDSQNNKYDQHDLVQLLDHLHNFGFKVCHIDIHAIISQPSCWTYCIITDDLQLALQHQEYTVFYIGQPCTELINSNVYIVDNLQQIQDMIDFDLSL